MKQTDLKLIKGGGREPSPPPSSNGTSVWEYVALFAVSAVIWLALGYWIYKYFAGSQ